MTQNRRQNARLVETIPFRIAYGDYDLACHTVNISSTGLLCRVECDVPLMTKIKVLLILPGASGRRPRSLRLDGVVVRSEKDPAADYRIAVFFTDVSKTNRGLLEAYIQEKMGGKAVP